MHAATLLPLSLLTTTSALTVWVSEMVTETQLFRQEIQVIVDSAGHPWTTITKNAFLATSGHSLPSSSQLSFSTLSASSRSSALAVPPTTASTGEFLPYATTQSTLSATRAPSHHSHVANYNYIPNESTSVFVTTSPELILSTSSTSSPASTSTSLTFTTASSSTSPTSATTSTSPTSNTASISTSTTSAQFSGDATFYNVGLGACGVTNTDSELIAALNKDQWEQFGSMSNGNPVCGKQARIEYQGKSVTVTIQDKCPGCAHGDLDLSPAAFQQLADEGAGRIQMSWSFL